MDVTHASTSILNRLGDAIKCFVCKNTFTDPRILPCFHTFCSKCVPLKEPVTREEGIYHCSRCEQDFKIHGPDGAPMNFFINKLLELVNIEKAIVAKESFCELCFDDQAGRVKSPLASYYCVECRQKICDECCKRHKKSNFQKAHSCVDFKHVDDLDEFYKKFVADFWASHRDELIKLYCNDCSMAICLVCYAEKHYQHNCQAVDKAADSCRELLSSKIKELGEMFEDNSKKEEECQDKKHIIDSQMAASKRDICEATENIKKLVDEHARKLLHELEINNIDNELKLKSSRLKLEKHKDRIKCVERHITQLGKYGSSEDICNSVSTISSRCTELEDLHELLNKEWNLNMDLFEFKESPFPSVWSVDGENILGKINKKAGINQLAGDKDVSSKIEQGTDTSTGNQASMDICTENKSKKGEANNDLKGVGNCFKLQTTDVSCFSSMHFANLVTGMAVVDNSLIVVQSGSSLVKIYDKVSSELHSSVEIPAMTDPYDAVGHKNFLYVSERHENSIHKIHLQQKTGTKWNVGHNRLALSISKQQQLLALFWAVSGSQFIAEYDVRNGTLIRKIRFGEAMNVRHAVSWTHDNRFLISRYKCVNGCKRVCVVNTQGCVVKSNPRCIDTGNTSELIRLSVNKDGFILVLDQTNNNVIMLNSNLEFVRDVIPKKTLRHPYRMCLDDVTGRLYVSDGKDKFRIMCFDKL